MLIVGLTEEYLFRGYALQSLWRGAGFWPAALITTAIFAGDHLEKPHENAIDIAMIFALGLILCISVRVTGSLWWAVGWHAAFDFGQFFIIGTPNAATAGPIVRYHISGPRLGHGRCTRDRGELFHDCCRGSDLYLRPPVPAPASAGFTSVTKQALGTNVSAPQIWCMANLATWIRAKDAKWFCAIFAKHPEIRVWNARNRHVRLEKMDGLLLTGGPDISPEFLHQENVDPSLIDKDDLDPQRDRWEFEAISQALARGLPILAICRGIQVLNVAWGGTLQLDIPGHRLPEQKDQDIQPLRYDGRATHRFEKVNSSHHQAIDRLAEGFEIEAWCADDGIIEQVRLRNYPFALAVQYHPERGRIYDPVFEDFFERVETLKR
jgi:putative glutamine amidotransferase